LNDWGEATSEAPKEEMKSAIIVCVLRCEIFAATNQKISAGVGVQTVVIYSFNDVMKTKIVYAEALNYVSLCERVSAVLVGAIVLKSSRISKQTIVCLIRPGMLIKACQLLIYDSLQSTVYSTGFNPFLD
jgi:hypothetical protein